MNQSLSNLADRRQHSRIEVQQSLSAAICEAHEGLSVTAQVLDVSLGGARVKLSRALESVQDTVEVLIEGVRTIAQIVWRSPTEIGLRYVEQAGDAAVDIFEKVITREFSIRKTVTAC
jgi:hypothetical protein